MYAAKKQVNTAMHNGFAVVELFTSEGCSSCPPADALAAKLSEEYKGKVFVLGFHVDYWNRLGWKDAFSNAAYSERQQKYAQLFKLNSIYTPQVIVNGKREMVGSNESGLRNTIISFLQNTNSASINVQAKNTAGKTVTVDYKTDQSAGKVLNIALVELHAVTNVKRGENEGHTLQHSNIVRDFKTVIADNGNGKILLQLPEDITAKDCKIICYLQDLKSLEIKAATEVMIE